MNDSDKIIYACLKSFHLTERRTLDFIDEIEGEGLNLLGSLVGLKTSPPYFFAALIFGNDSRDPAGLYSG